MKIAEFLEVSDVIDADDLMAHFDLAPHVRPFIFDMLAAQGYRRRADGRWRRAGRITLANLSLSPAGGGRARTTIGGVRVEYRHRRQIQPQGQPVSIWDERHKAMMRHL